MQHLLHKSAFEQLLGVRPCARTEHFFAHRLSAAEAQASRIGVLIPKRHAKRAVTRNLIRRQIYALMGTAHEQLDAASRLAKRTHCLYLIRLRAGFSQTAFPSAASSALKASVRAELQAVMAQLLR